VEGRAPVVFKLADQVRPDAAQTLRRLASSGLAIEMLSGDRETAVARVAREVGVPAYLARMTPAAKLARVETLGREGHKVLMVGDGINDAPALAAAFASIAPSTASDIGRTAADIVFMGSSLSAITIARKVALDAQSIARQNFMLAIGYNLFAVPIAMMGLATPLIAAVAMSSSSLIVIANALRLGLTAHKATRRSAPGERTEADSRVLRRAA
jgi:Cu2+-exporting ATPase